MKRASPTVTSTPTSTAASRFLPKTPLATPANALAREAVMGSLVEGLAKAPAAGLPAAALYPPDAREPGGFSLLTRRLGGSTCEFSGRRTSGPQRSASYVCMSTHVCVCMSICRFRSEALEAMGYLPLTFSGSLGCKANSLWESIVGGGSAYFGVVLGGSQPLGEISHS